jgi:hypothetical protein
MILVQVMKINILLIPGTLICCTRIISVQECGLILILQYMDQILRKLKIDLKLSIYCFVCCYSITRGQSMVPVLVAGLRKFHDHLDYFL